MEYIMKHKDKPLLIFQLGEDVNRCLVNKKYKKYLPLPLQRIFQDPNGLIAEITNDFYVLSEDGCFLLDAWLLDREIPSDRSNKDKYLANGEGTRKLMLSHLALSLNDCYWIHSTNENYKWDDMKLYNNKIKIIDLIPGYNQEHYHGYNSTLGGALEKFWFIDKNSNKLRLCKKVEKENSILNFREIIANMICESLDYSNYCKYEYVYDTKKEVVGCVCDSFTNEKLELITAYDILESKNMTRQDAVYELLIENAVMLGGDPDEIRFHLDFQTVLDFIITNRDRHQNNIGFIRNSSTLQLLYPAPIYDSGSSASFEGRYPESVYNTTIHGLYSTELEMLTHVSSWNKIDFSKLPDVSVIQKELDKCTSISSKRKETLLNLYQEKREFLIDLSRKQNIPEYLKQKMEEISAQISENPFISINFFEDKESSDFPDFD